MCSSLPATGPRWSSSTTSVSGAAETSRSSRGALRVERGASRVLPARRDDRGARAARERGGSRPGSMPRSSSATGSSSSPRARSRSIQRGVAGVLDRDAVARPQLRLEHPLDAVERAADDAQRIARGRRRRCSCSRASSSSSGTPAARRTGARAAPAARAQRPGRAAARVGVAARQITRARRDRQRRPERADRRPFADARAAPLLGDHDAAPAQLGQRRPRRSPGLRPTSAARRRTEGSRCPGASAPLATPPRCSRTSSAALAA